MGRDNIILNTDFVELIYVDEEYHKNHSQLIHKHDDVLELFYIMSGSGQYTAAGRTYPVQRGSLVICNAGVMHGESPYWHNTMLSYCCVLRGLSIPGLPHNTLTDAARSPVCFFIDDRETVEYILLALHHQKCQPDVSPAVSHLLANALLNLVYAKLRHLSDDADIKHNEEFLQNIATWLDQHYMEPVTLEELGRRFHISPSYLSHIFKTETGFSPMKYLLYRRIGESQRLLMNSELPVSSISDQLGFNDSSHFCRTFKKYIGLTPSAYRRHFRGTHP